MLASGVQLLEAMDIVRGLLNNVILEQVVSEARDNIREGEGVAPALRRQENQDHRRGQRRDGSQFRILRRRVTTSDNHQ